MDSLGPAGMIQVYRRPTGLVRCQDLVLRLHQVAFLCMGEKGEYKYHRLDQLRRASPDRALLPDPLLPAPRPNREKLKILGHILLILQFVEQIERSSLYRYI